MVKANSNVMNLLNTTRDAQRKAIEGMYEDTATIWVKKLVKDPETKKSKNIDVKLVEDEPCRLSFRTMPSTSDAMKNNEFADYVNQVITLFIRPDIDVPAGSKIEITRFKNNPSRSKDEWYVQTYRNSALRKVHGVHQEIILMLADKYDKHGDYIHE